jgi:hypothetical protein
MACVLCGRDLKEPLEEVHGEFASLAKCDTCGTFVIDGTGLRSKAFDEPELKPFKYRLSALTKTSSVPFRISRRTRDDLKAGLPGDKTVSEKIELVVRWFAEKSTEVGQRLGSRSHHDYPAAWCKSPQEWQTLLRHVESIGLLQVDGIVGEEAIVSVTVKGWQWLSDRPKATGSKAFIAMAFDSALDDVKAAIHKAIERAGYDPLRVDDDHYSGGVMDRIITHIRDSKFIVADFTKNRGGVYYEAGVAFGLGIDVINVCDAECLKKDSTDPLHFDVRHLVFVPWAKGQLEQFADDLSHHIIAIHGRGPRPVA